jgi:hypothetical protein
MRGLVIQDHHASATVDRVGKKKINPAKTSADSPVRALRSDQQFSDRRAETRSQSKCPRVWKGQIFHFPNVLETFEACC